MSWRRHHDDRIVVDETGHDQARITRTHRSDLIIFFFTGCRKVDVTSTETTVVAARAQLRTEGDLFVVDRRECRRDTDTSSQDRKASIANRIGKKDEKETTASTTSQPPPSTHLTESARYLYTASQNFVEGILHVVTLEV